MIFPADLEDVARRTTVDVEAMDRLGDDPQERSGLKLASSGDHDIWLLRWPPGSRVTPHDHGDSAGAFAVVAGELIEVRWSDGTPQSRVVTAGESVTIGPGVVHDVAAATSAAYSVHVYYPPLTEMSFYDESANRCVGTYPAQRITGDWAVTAHA